MSIAEQVEKKERINVLLPSSLLAELRELVPPRERSNFIAELPPNGSFSSSSKRLYRSQKVHGLTRIILSCKPMRV